ncbi:hypothetical protein [Cruoricaptor ignavus]|uniref:Histidine kinase n=2 Tax=Cruoricaptor ignavus TaxID=1118202 RepID=A0A7M1T4Z3_9FLAO|nr:hypothetical protein [Cruoricaptor ignavus]QOR74910.1 hypothetical protein IMZ16_02180 [Cruoricaptor ignavus]
MMNTKNNDKGKTWLKRVGIGGLVFFTVKGLAWLAVFYLGAEGLRSCGG